MPSLAPHISTVPGSGIRRIYEIATQLDGIISLGVGEPDVVIAPHIAEAAQRAWAAGHTNYTANAGIPALRAAIVEKLERVNGLVVDTERVFTTVGATQAIYQALTLTLGDGDEVLVPDPGYTTFSMGARMLNAVPVPYSLTPERGFLPNIEELDRLVSDRTRVIIINSPSNPLGIVYGEAVLRQLIDFARRHDLWVISDEVYEAFTWNEKHESIARFDDDGRVFSIFSLSKTYAMTGIRVGYMVTPPGLAAIMRTVQEASISCVAEPAQYAAIAAITGDQSHVEEAKRHYRDNFDAAAALLDEHGIRYHRPAGSFYLWIDVSHDSAGDVAAWAEGFLLHKLVAVAPGSAFGRSGEGWIRVCLAAPADTLLEGLRRLPRPDGEAAA